MNESRLLQLCGWAIGRLKTDRAVRIKENIQVTGRLDYPRKDIHMALDNVVQIARLGACRKEPETVAWLEANMRPDDVFFDVGANVGAYSFVADTVAGGRCSVYAFEPSYSTFAALVTNVQLNRCSDRIRTLQLALSNETKLETFNYSSTSAGAAMHGLKYAINEDGEPFEPAHQQVVMAFRMDDLLPQFGIPLPNHVKIDVDGAELLVIEGARRTLGNPTLRSMLIEVDHRKDTHTAILHEISALGLRLVSKNPRNGPGLFNYVFDRAEPS